MKQFFIAVFYLVFQFNANAQGFSKAEYFFDTDPGFGSATAIAITPGVNLTNVPVTVNTAGLSNGFHRLFLRTKNAEGRWALVTIKDFLYDFNCLLIL